MPSQVNAENRSLLAMYGITLKKELKASVTVKIDSYDDDLKMSRAMYEKLLSAIKSCKQRLSLPCDKATFGVELEFIGTRACERVDMFSKCMRTLVTRSLYLESLQYRHNGGLFWILGRDGSLNTCDTEIYFPFGYELSSPVLSLFNKGDREILSNVIDLCKTYLDATINKSCGTHIHIGFTPDKIYRAQILNLLSAYSYMEKTVFDPIVPVSRRRNKYCKTTRPSIRNKYQKLSTRYCEFNYEGECNTLHFEFRQLEGTLDIRTILYWAELQATVIRDLLDHINDYDYIESLKHKNIFDILYYYAFTQDLTNFFVNRAIQFKSINLVKGV